jgi:hypothetical protein
MPLLTHFEQELNVVLFLFFLFLMLQAYTAGIAMSGLVASVLRLITRATFGNSHSGLRKGACEFTFKKIKKLVQYGIYYIDM